MLSMEKDNNIFSRVEVDIFVKWLWYFIKYYEDEDKVSFCMMLMNYYITEDQNLHFGELGETARAKLVDYLSKSFFRNGDMLFESCFVGMTMANVNTSINQCCY